MNGSTTDRLPLLVATRNRHKLREMRRILRDLDVRLRDATEFPDVPDAAEDGRTFEENARRKAIHYARATGLLAVADDSGLEVDALGGLPGPRSARFAGEDATDRQNLEHLLERLRGVPRERRGARYRCVMVLATPEGRVLATTEGVCEGRIREEESGGTEGFGYDPVFLVPELERTFAEVPAEEKDRRSHRGMAARALRPTLQAVLARTS